VKAPLAPTWIASSCGARSEEVRAQPEADRPTLIRRVAFDLTRVAADGREFDGLPADKSPDAYEKMGRALLASPAYGERWASTGSMPRATPTPTATSTPTATGRSRGVTRLLPSSRSTPTSLTRFLASNSAGDELAGFKKTPGGDVTPRWSSTDRDSLHPNAPDGTGESDGNPDEVRIDRYTVLEGNVQNVANALLGITVQLCRCTTTSLSR